MSPILELVLATKYPRLFHYAPVWIKPGWRGRFHRIWRWLAFRSPLRRWIVWRHPKSMERNTMYYGCTIQDGWYGLFSATCAAITAVDPDAKLEQVKEKFGALRIYLEGNDLAREAARWAEKASVGVCEYCGDTETAAVRRGAWVKTVCDTCEWRRQKGLGSV